MTEAAKGHLAVLLFAVFVSGSMSLGALVANDIAPSAITAMRFLLAALVLVGVAMVTTGLSWSTYRAPWRFLVLGAVFSVYFVLMFEGLKTMAPISGAAVFTLTPVITALFGWILLRQVTTPWMAVALAIGATGALWVIFRADIQALLGFEIGRGEVTYFVGCIAHSLYTPLVRFLNRGEPAVPFTIGTLIAGTVLLCLYGWADLRDIDWVGLPGYVWAVIVYLAVFSSAISFVLIQYGAMRLPAAKVMAYTYFTPTCVILWEIALGHGAPTGLVLGGVALTILSLTMLLRDDT